MTDIFNKFEFTQKRKDLRKKQTLCEKLLWEQIRNRKLLNIKFRRQVSINAYIVDFYSPELKLVIEVDGEIHDKEDNISYDLKRQSEIESLGLQLIRFKNKDILDNLNLVLSSICDVITNLKSCPNPPLLKKERGQRDCPNPPLLKKERGQGGEV